MGLEDITGTAEEEHEEEKVDDYLDQMEEHVEEIERLQNLVVAMSNRLEQLEDRMTVLEQAVGGSTTINLDEQDVDEDSFLDGEWDTEEEDDSEDDDQEYSWG